MSEKATLPQGEQKMVEPVGPERPESMVGEREKLKDELYEARASLNKTEEGAVMSSLSTDKEFIASRREGLEKAQQRYDEYVAGLAEQPDENKALLEQIETEEREYWENKLKEAEEALDRTMKGADLADVSSDKRFVELRERQIEKARNALAKYQPENGETPQEGEKEEPQQ
jgi:hypothetical protein